MSSFLSRGILAPFADGARNHWFLGGMFAAVVLASLFPELGRNGGTLHGDIVANAGIAFIFFMHGLGVSLTGLRHGVSRWRIHLFVQCCTFALFPIIWLPAHFLVQGVIPQGLSLGFLYLAVLPSTISSSVALTGLARGNVPAAIFNATLSSLLGIVLTPALMSIFAGIDAAVLSIRDAMLGIAKLVLLPLLLGQLMRPMLHRWHARAMRYTNPLDRCIIVMLVFNAFCNSVSSGLWYSNGPGTLFIALVGAAIMLGAVLALGTAIAKSLNLPVEDEIAAVFCGATKALATGVPMANLLFGTHPALGLIVLPIMFYHPLQLFACSILASRYARRI